MNANNSVVVIGATGMIGAPVTNRLFEEDMIVTAFVRNMEKAKVKLHSGINLVEGNLKRPDQLRSAFRGTDTVYLNLSTGPFEKDAPFKTEIDGVYNVIEAAKETGVKRIGFLSSLIKNFQGIDWWVFDIKREACRILLDSDVPATIFYPSNFFENFPVHHIIGSRLILLGEQKTKSWWVGTRDYASQVAVALQQKHNENREYPVQGHEPMNYEEAAEVFINHYPFRKLKKARIPLGFLNIFKKFSAKIDYNYNIIYAINNYNERFQSEKTWRELGKPQQRLAEFTRTL